MKSNNYLISLPIMFLIFAVALSVVLWGDISAAAKISFYGLGFGSGVTAMQWLAKRKA